MTSIYSKSVIDSINNISQMYNFIMGLSDFGEGGKYTAMVKAEIRRVIQMANRRIQNVKSSNLASPALKALEAERGATDKFSVFSIRGMGDDIERLKYEYGRAMSYLSNPTSTSRGARQYIEYTANELGVTFEGANHIIDLATDPQVSETGYVNIMSYGSILDIMKDSLMSVREDFARDERAYIEHIEQLLAQATIADAMHGQNRGLYGGLLNLFF